MNTKTHDQAVSEMSTSDLIDLYVELKEAYTEAPTPEESQKFFAQFELVADELLGREIK